MALVTQHQALRGLTAWQQHCRLVKDLQTYYGATLPALEETQRTDLDSLIQHHRFIRTEEDDRGTSPEARLARRYYAKLFREYAVVDLSHYKKGLFGLRWRTKKEVVDGKGQFCCGERQCPKQQSLASYELPFTYTEAGQQKTALIKVRLCPEHVLQLLYRKTRDSLKQQQRQKRKASSPTAHRKTKRRREGPDAAAGPAAEDADPEAAQPAAASGQPASQQPMETADTLLAETVAAWDAAAETRTRQRQ